MLQKELEINSADGTLLHLKYSIPEGHAALALIVHGLGEHSGRYDELTGFLNKRGFAVFRLDLRGHGRSAGKHAHVTAFDEYLSDVMVASAKAMEISGYKRFVLVGHSMGGLICANFAGLRHGLISGLVLSSPFFGFAQKPPAVKAFFGSIISRIYPSLSLATGLDAGLVSRDPEIVRKYTSDPLVHGVISARWFTEVLSQQNGLERFREYKGPLLMMQAGADGLASPEASRLAFEASPADPKEFHMLDGLYHEIFNELEDDRKKVFGILDRWLKARGLGSKARA
ncbi:MAG: lysophospholipase [Myxococcota bacterium]|jgi:alpha-beta hydrolase superfamily lysophospholipase